MTTKQTARNAQCSPTTPSKAMGMHVSHATRPRFKGPRHATVVLQDNTNMKARVEMFYVSTANEASTQTNETKALVRNAREAVMHQRMARQYAHSVPGADTALILILL